MRNILLVFTLFTTVVTFAQNRMTPELLWDLKRVGGIKVSPDFKSVLYSERTYDLALNSSRSEFYIVNVKTQEKSKMPNISSRARSVQWRPDGEKIGFLLRDDLGDNIYEINVDGTDLKKISAFHSKMIEFKYSPDGGKVMFTKDVKLDKFQSREFSTDLVRSNAKVYDDLMYRHWSDYADGQYTHIFYSIIDRGLVAGTGIDIMANEKFHAPLKPFGGLEQATFSPDGSKIAYTSKKMTGKEYATSTNSDVYIYDVSTRRTVNLSKGMMGYDTNPIYSKDGKYIGWLSMKTDGFESDKNDIVIYNIQTQEKQNLTESIDLTISDFVWDDTNKQLFYKASTAGTYQLYSLNIETKKYKPVTKGMHNYTSLAFAGDKLIGGKQSMNHPTDVYAVDYNKMLETQLTNANKAIYDSIDIGKIEKRWVKTTDGLEQLVWVIYPPNFDPAKKYPALLYCQGGPQSAVSQFFSYRWNFQLMAANDYIIIAPNRRGLPGFGQQWNDDISGDWGGQPMDDYLAAVDELKKEPFIDEERIGAVGASYGGYSVYYLAGIHDNRFSCFISHCGLFNLESWYGTTEELFFANYDIGGPYYGDSIPKGYIKNSPHRKAHNWNTPMLIFQGEKDYRVPMGQGLEAFQALQIKDIPSRLVLFPEENHWILSPQNGVFWHRQYYAWLNKYLK
ncbi:MAG: alpha/beta fold hydrolase [Crocinitomicaceae bacterium]